MARQERKYGIDELRRVVEEQVKEGIAEDGDEFFSRMEPRLKRWCKDIAAGEVASLTLTAVAIVCRDALAWDSWSFLDTLGVDHTDSTRAEPTSKGRRELRRLNAGQEWTLSLDNWST